MISAIDEIEVYESIKRTIGEDGSKALLRYIDERAATQLATKSDLVDTEAHLRAEMRAQFETLRIEMRAGFEKLHAEIARR